jgi:hypothetical protein
MVAVERAQSLWNYVIEGNDGIGRLTRFTNGFVFFNRRETLELAERYSYLTGSRQ